MRRATILAAALVTAAPAAARDFYCTLTTPAGQHTQYVFSEDAQGDWIEYSITKGGSTLTHAPDRRPVWETTTVGVAFAVVYVPDRRYRLVMANNPDPLGNGMYASRTILYKDLVALAEGACGYQNRLGRRSSPIPERF